MLVNSHRLYAGTALLHVLVGPAEYSVTILPNKPSHIGHRLCLNRAKWISTVKIPCRAGNRISALTYLVLPLSCSLYYRSPQLVPLLAGLRPP